MVENVKKVEVDFSLMSFGVASENLRKSDNAKSFPLLAEDSNAISWAGSDRDYTYDELLNRVFDIILEKNPDMAAGRKPKFVMRPPQVLRVGTKKTSFANFTEICKTLHRWGTEDVDDVNEANQK